MIALLEACRTTSPSLAPLTELPTRHKLLHRIPSERMKLTELARAIEGHVPVDCQQSIEPLLHHGQASSQSHQPEPLAWTSE